MIEGEQPGLSPEKGPGRLGFGTAGLAALDDRRKVWKLLEAALECGVRHFDTARLYGNGTMERIISPFLRANRSAVTITTKFGLNGRWRGQIPSVMIPLARRMVKSFWKPRRPQSMGPPKPHDPPVPDLSVVNMRRSLAISLRELGVDCVDYFLMHEPRAGLVSPALIEALEEERRAGRIHFYGGGGEWANTMELASLRWPFSSVMQVPIRIGQDFDEVLPAPGIIHSVYRGLRFFEEEAGRRRQWQDSFPGGPFRAGESLPALLLHRALAQNPAGKVLFGASTVSRIRWNARVAGECEGVGMLNLRMAWLRGLIAAAGVS